MEDKNFEEMNGKAVELSMKLQEIYKDYDPIVSISVLGALLVEFYIFNEASKYKLIEYIDRSWEHRIKGCTECANAVAETVDKENSATI